MQLKHIVKQTLDPHSRYTKGLAWFTAGYYQHAREFSDVLYAVFGGDSPIVTALVERGSCTLEFEQFSQRYTLPCEVAQRNKEDVRGFCTQGRGN